MNATTLTALVFVLGLAPLRAQERFAPWDWSASRLPAWTTPRWDAPVEQRAPRLMLGRSDYAVSGPLVDTFRLRPNRYPDERSLGRKILDLPIINIFVPEPMARPTRQGGYFYWGERDVPWASVVERRPSGPSGVLVSVGR